MASSQATRRSTGGSVLARFASASVLLPLLLLLTWAGSFWFTLLVTAAALLGLLEFYHLARGRGARPAVMVGLSWTAALVIAGAAYGAQGAGSALGAGLLVSGGLVLVRRKRHSALADWAFTVAGALYLGITLLHAPLLRQGEDGFAWVMVVLAGTFAADTGAYATGRILGRQRMAPRISPGKTWEGTVGGLVAATAVTTVVVAAQGLPVAVWLAAVLGGSIGFLSVLGDLAESLLKRAARAKEAGRLIPGHGGVLDRLDSLVFTVVLVYYFARGVAT